eukprot:CAMPEP_0206265520 /NCGR_PEP_ID=MMETSP0047_2-20121206/30046_1 /ASSEMBLY_ACC=CAM_ASM_000192 /TAXON_ID=195065 /ORGANISM="Chroomonas mesostigmatica_cf, Strain CCMP1168" /LENGTH=350 /DNA_ID=CAMNT_0053693435 /DNA_START=1 /DNA_END=1050 /DNA_ORIENTATION=-
MALPCPLDAIAVLVEAATLDGQATAVGVDVEGPTPPHFSLLTVQCEGATKSKGDLVQMLLDGIPPSGAPPPPSGGGGGASSQGPAIWRSLTRLGSGSVVLVRDFCDECHALLVSEAFAAGAEGHARVPCVRVAAGGEAAAADLLAHGPLKSWSAVLGQAESMPDEVASVRFLVGGGSLAFAERPHDLLVGFAALTEGEYTFDGEAKGEDGLTYKSEMLLEMRRGGSIVGDERGQVAHGREVSGKISGGRWAADGAVELDYVFEDGTVFTYAGQMAGAPRTFAGRWFLKAPGWEGSDQRNRGTFALDMRPREDAVVPAAVADKASAAHLLGALYADGRARLSLRGALVHPV